MLNPLAKMGYAQPNDQHETSSEGGMSSSEESILAEESDSPPTFSSSEGFLNSTDNTNETDDSSSTAVVEVLDEVNEQAVVNHFNLLDNVFETIDLKDNEKTIVDTNHLEEYFDFHGNATSDGAGLVTLTQKETSQNGNITLKEKLLADYPIILTGEVNLGSDKKGADGMGFGFHTSENTAIGQTGMGMGIAGLENAFGFKLDTFYNSNASGSTAKDPSEFAGGTLTSSKAFGSFVYTDDQYILQNYGGVEGPAKEIEKPSNNTFRKFSLVYNPGISNKILSINYDGEIWHTDVSQWLSSDIEELSFLISAATGAATNMHQIKIERMEYVTVPEETPLVTVTKDNFLEHFALHGNATYDETTGTLTLTEDQKNQSGNATLIEKVSNLDPLEFKGKVNLGNGSGSRYGDGIGIGFHRSDARTVGQSGQGMGIAGLASAFGFKLDTHYNGSSEQNAASDPSEFSGSGLFESEQPFGAYVYTDNFVLQSYMGTEAPGRKIATPSKNGFKNFKLTYNPGEHSKILSVEYDGQIWHKDVSEWQGDLVTAFSFIVSASTGDKTNLHQIEIESFDYVVGQGDVLVEYRDIETDEAILESQEYIGKLETTVQLDPQNRQTDKPYLEGYDFVEVVANESFDDENNIAIYSDEQQIITYYFQKATSIVNLNYLDTDGQIIQASKKVEGYVKENYQITPDKINHYEFVTVKGDEPLTGVFEREEQTITLIYRLLAVSPVDPLEPEIDVEPEEQPQLPDEQGLVSIDFVSKFTFGTQKIGLQAKTYYAQPQRLLDEEGNATINRPNYVQISDRRSDVDSGGWTLSVTQNEQFSGSDNQELVGAQLQLMNQQLATAQGEDEPTLSSEETVSLIPGEATTLLSAGVNEGKGTWVYRFGDGETYGESVGLHLPTGTIPDTTTYTTTLVWELQAVPEK